MQERPDIPALFLHFLMLAAISIGGTDTVLPDMHRYLVEVHGWITSRQFSDAYAIARAVPGPNMLYATLLGWQVGGLAGALATTLALAIPPVTITLLVVRLSARRPASPLGRAFKLGLAPITIGLMFSSSWILLRAVHDDWRGYVVTFITLAVVLRSRLNPLWLIAAGALLGIAGAV